MNIPTKIDPTTPNEIRETWLQRLDADRPIYVCPKCGELSMQFFRMMPEGPQSPERVDSYVCFACGRNWQM
jgi:DNA-directed RNA polymerase subunit RPC12/RpoP